MKELEEEFEDDKSWSSCATSNLEEDIQFKNLNMLKVYN